METNINSLEAQPIPWKIRLAYQIFGVLFGMAALWTLVLFVSFSLRNFFDLIFLIYSVAFIGFNGTLAYGFWKMRKWMVTITGSMTFFIAISIIAIIGRNRNISQAIAGLVIFGALFLFTYFSRKFLSGDYKDLKALGLFSAFLIISQMIVFLK